MQAVQWAQAAGNLGQGFCGSPQAVAGFRSMVTAHSRSAFEQLHAAKLDSLYSMLDKELWKSVPAPQTPGATIAHMQAPLVHSWYTSLGCITGCAGDMLRSVHSSCSSSADER